MKKFFLFGKTKENLIKETNALYLKWLKNFDHNSETKCQLISNLEDEWTSDFPNKKRAIYLTAPSGFTQKAILTKNVSSYSHLVLTHTQGELRVYAAKGSYWQVIDKINKRDELKTFKLFKDKLSSDLNLIA